MAVLPWVFNDRKNARHLECRKTYDSSPHVTDVFATDFWCTNSSRWKYIPLQSMRWGSLEFQVKQR